MAQTEADLAAVSEQLEVGFLYAAYRAGLFPMGLGQGGSGPVGWWSPHRRGVLFPGDLRVSRSLRRSMRAFTITWNTAFDRVVRACAETDREGTWITPQIIEAYSKLAARGQAKSVEVWNAAGDLVGGLYGVDLGVVFAGESMFHREADASKAALVGLVRHLDERFPDEGWLIETQWATPHLQSLGVSEITEAQYAEALESRGSLSGLQGFLKK